ncbi:MAG: DNA replication/repair protein RecF [Bacteroidia bacterium]|nr:DNA replication/repair protein RecF [Bacteroidota bacterium]MBP9082177.1 DNA replication/repair protein RecF [Bacteroidia bacterium]
MLILRKLQLINFRNYADASISFGPAVNCFTGTNGSGKTNLLDAIHYLSMTKSYFSPTDNQNIRHHEAMLMIQGEFELNGEQESVLCAIRQGQKKIFKRNQKEYEKLSNHIGTFPVVMIAPTDQELITEGSEIRRRFIDGIISQSDHIYLDNLIRYNQVISQRNTLLKQANSRGFADWGSISVWDDQLAHYGQKIFEKRKEFIRGFEPHFNALFDAISGTGQSAGVSYESPLQDRSLSEILLQNRSRDLDLQYTSSGTHKDDLTVTLNGFPARKFASQGQQKSLVIALKLAHFNYLCELGFQHPIILLDDIFDKLDQGRVSRLMELITKGESGQIFITDTHKERVAAIFESMNIPCKLFDVENGVITLSENQSVQ